MIEDFAVVAQLALRQPHAHNPTSASQVANAVKFPLGEHRTFGDAFHRIRESIEIGAECFGSDALVSKQSIHRFDTHAACVAIARIL
jgi:hypothetical protein